MQNGMLFGHRNQLTYIQEEEKMTEFRNDDGYGELHIVGWDEPKNDKDCDHDWQRDNSVVLTSYPPQHVYVCSKCGAKKTEPAYTVPAKTDDLVEDLRLQLEESRALQKGLEAKLSLAEAKIKRLVGHQEPMEAKIENQARELARFNEIFAQLKWFKDSDGEYRYMSGPMMLKVIKRAEAKTTKWKQCAIEAEDRVIDLSDDIDYLTSLNCDLSKKLSDINDEWTKTCEALDEEKEAHEGTKTRLIKYRDEYNKLAEQFISLYEDLYACCDYQGEYCSACYDCGAKERYRDISEALKQGLWISDPKTRFIKGRDSIATERGGE
jgi:hypothetical protein